METKKIILVLSRNEKHEGGVVNYIKCLMWHFNANIKDFSIEKFTIGKRYGSNSIVYTLLTNICDLLLFTIKLFNKKYIMVHLNPSLGIIPIIRDACFLLITKMHKKKSLVFWHGWDSNIEKQIENRIMLKRLFLIIYRNANATVVLATSFKKKLLQWGFKHPIFVETTTFDDRLTKEFTIKKKIENIRECKKIQVLFLSRIEEKKGIITTIDAFIKIKNNKKNLKLMIAGDGPDKVLVHRYLKKISDGRIKLLGYVKGFSKIKLLQESHIMCLPTSYGEGLPVSILESMAFGIPIITTPVGGITDIFKDDINGIYLNSQCKDELAKMIEILARNKSKLIRISKNNYKYAHSKFAASIVSKRVYKIYKEVSCE